MNTFLSFADIGRVNVLRYQPIPPGNEPPWLVAGASFMKSDSRLQSCGNESARQRLSLNFGSIAKLSLPKKNFHPLLKSISERGWATTLNVMAKRRIKYVQYFFNVIIQYFI